MAASVSFVIPVFNDEDYLDQCLEAIVRECTEVELAFEIIVIDNGSTDNSKAVASRHDTQVFSIERTSISNARNIGTGHAKYEIVAFIDSDVVITYEWAITLIENYSDFMSHPLFIAGHQYEVRSNPSWIEANWFKNITDKLFAGGNLIASREAHEALGGFDVTLKTGEDYDFCARAIDSGFRYLDRSGFKAIHLGFPNTLSGFTKRELWHGEGDFKSLFFVIKSPVAMIALVYLFVQLSVVALLLVGSVKEGVYLFGILLVFNFAITWYRFAKCTIVTILINSTLNYLYFCARSMSWMRVLFGRRAPRPISGPTGG